MDRAGTPTGVPACFLEGAEGQWKFRGSGNLGAVEI